MCVLTQKSDGDRTLDLLVQLIIAIQAVIDDEKQFEGVFIVGITLRDRFFHSDRHNKEKYNLIAIKTSGLMRMTGLFYPITIISVSADERIVGTINKRGILKAHLIRD